MIKKFNKLKVNNSPCLEILNKFTILTNISKKAKI